MDTYPKIKKIRLFNKGFCMFKNLQKNSPNKRVVKNNSVYITILITVPLFLAYLVWCERYFLMGVLFGVYVYILVNLIEIYKNNFSQDIDDIF